MSWLAMLPTAVPSSVKAWTGRPLASAVRRVAPRATTAASVALRGSGQVLDGAAIERRLEAARRAFAGFDVVVAPSASLAREYAGLGLPTVLVQEGGYLSDDLGRNLVQFLAGFEKGRS